MGATSQNPSADVCTRIAPEEWSALVDDPNTVVFDTRKSYVSAIDRFQSTMDPLGARTYGQHVLSTQNQAPFATSTS